MGQYAELLKGVSIFADLSDAAIGNLENLFMAKNYPKDALIVSQEEKGDSLFVISHGRVKVVLFGESGREIILSIFRRGDFFGEMSLLDDQPRSANVLALEKSELLVLRRQSFVQHLREHHEIALKIMAELSRRLRKADEIIGNLALLDVYGRVARNLLDNARAEGVVTDEGILIKERPTQQDIASMVGTSRETVSRALSEFARRGFVEVSGRSILLKHQRLLEEEYTVK
jgi:CRP-like cAMP-binding protein